MMHSTKRAQKRLQACTREADKAILARNIDAVSNCLREVEPIDRIVRKDEGPPSFFTKLLAVLEVNPRTGEIIEAVHYQDRERSPMEGDLRGLVLDYRVMHNPNRFPDGRPSTSCVVRPEDTSIALSQTGLSLRALYNIRQLNTHYAI